MASAQAAGRRQKGTQADGWYPLPLEEVADRLQATRPRTLRRDCLESRDRAYRWCVRRCFAEGPCFRSTLTQAAKGMGYPLTDDDEQNFNSFAKSVRRCLDDLRAAGLIQSWGGVKRSDGRWRCIEVCMPDSTAQRTIISVMSTWCGRGGSGGLDTCPVRAAAPPPGLRRPS